PPDRVPPFPTRRSSDLIQKLNLELKHAFEQQHITAAVILPLIYDRPIPSPEFGTRILPARTLQPASPKAQWIAPTLPGNHQCKRSEEHTSELQSRENLV